MPRVAAILFATSLLACAVPGECRTGRQVKVVLEFQQQGQDSRQGAQGRGGVIIQDGGTASMLAASEVPFTVVVWFRDYAMGQGYAAQGTAWQRVGTTLIVSPSILLTATVQ